MFSKYAAFITVLFLAYSICGAQTVQPTTAPAPAAGKRKPITMEWGGLNGIHYYYAGYKADGVEGLSGIITSLHDPEATRLVAAARNDENTGGLFTVGGLVFLAAGAIVVGTDPNSQKTTQDIDGRQAAGLGMSLAGLVGGVFGLLNLDDAKADEFNAVQRYNAVVRGEDETSWNLPDPGLRTKLLTLKF